MKKTISIFLTFFLLTLVSCDSWLDVKPSTEKDREELIQSAAGFKQMLYGVYLGLADENLYGHQMTYGFIEAVASNLYFESYNNPFIDWKYLDQSARPVIDKVWSNSYNVIANANSILKDIDDRKSLFVDHEYEILKAEALAIRAFIHFDLLRLFAPNASENPDKSAIPYVETYERVRYPHLPVKKVVGKIIADLEQAARLLQTTDPILQGVNDTKSGKNSFLANRQYRFNYYAVLALTARVHLYNNNKPKATEFAQKILDDKIFNWVDSKTLTGNNPDVIFMPELICALNVSNLPDLYIQYFQSEKYKLSNTSDDFSSCIFDDPNDFRKLYLISNDSRGRKSLSAKYKQTFPQYVTLSVKKSTVPLIRMGELYLTLAETNLEQHPEETIRLLRLLRNKRGYLSNNQGIPDDISKNDLQSILIQEIRKEMYLEGQTFFTYKRLGLTQINILEKINGGVIPNKIIKTEDYIFPLPESEKEFGNIPKISPTTSL